MLRKSGFYGCLAVAFIIGSGTARAEPDHGAPAPHNAHMAAPHPAVHPGEPHPGPRGYHPVAPPHGWDTRPHAVDVNAYHHNYQAAHSFHIGPYHPPAGWVDRRWGYGEILPRAYWAPQYVLGDYWMFSLDVPPVGYEWVRDGADALLVNTVTGEILQVEYGVFA